MPNQKNKRNSLNVKLTFLKRLYRFEAAFKNGPTMLKLNNGLISLILINLFFFCINYDVQGDESEASANNRENKKGPYGNTVTNFGFDQFNIGMKFDEKDVKNIQRYGNHEDGSIKGYLYKDTYYNVSEYATDTLKCIGTKEQTEHHKKLINKLRDYGKYDEHLTILKAIKSSFKGVIHKNIETPGGMWNLSFVDNRIVEIGVKKEYPETGLSIEEFSKKIENVLGKPKNVSNLTGTTRDLFYEGRFITKHYKGLRELRPNAKLDKVNNFMWVRIQQENSIIKVRYYAVDVRAYRKASRDINNSCFSKVLEADKELLKKAEVAKKNFEL